MENQTKWVLDPTHSEIVFKIKHLMITNVKGEFRTFNAEVTTVGEDFNKAKVSATIDPSSIFTNNTDRDGHLQSADFFDVAQFNEIRFEGTGFEKLDSDNFKLKGDLTMKRITKEVSFDVEFGGLVTDPYGQNKAGFSLSGKINRKDWGLNWNAALEAGGVVVSDEVRINAEVQFVKQA